MILITGGAGFIGQHLVDALVSQGYEVGVILRTKEQGAVFSHRKEVETYFFDEKDPNQLKHQLQGKEVEGFYHFAWSGHAGTQREDYRLQLNNVALTCEAVELAKELDARQFIYAGSLMEYEATQYISQPGSQPPANYIYRTAKLTAHYMAKSLAVSLGVPFKTGIISNAYGAGETAPRFINTTLRKLLAKEPTAFTSGTQLYDFMYVSDVAEAFVLLLTEGKAFHDYYIGNKTLYPLHTFVERMGACVDPECVLGIGLLPFDGVSLHYDVIDTQGLYRDTSFCPKVSFEEGIEKTIHWIQTQESKK